MTESRIYRGKVRHRRFSPKRREFSHSVCYFYLDTAEIQKLFNKRGFFSDRGPSLFGFRRKAYLGPVELPLDEAARRKVDDKLGFRPSGPVRVLSQIAYLEFAFNPVSFYYCFGSDGSTLEAIIAEITNTPWNERYAYVMDCRSTQGSSEKGSSRFRFEKVFHVSPFLSMDYRYEWSFSNPGEHLNVHMVNIPTGHAESASPVFDATLTLQSLPWSPRNLAFALLAQPMMTFKTLLLIYGHAAVLWLRRFPVFTHPLKLGEVHPRTTQEKIIPGRHP